MHNQSSSFITVLVDADACPRGVMTAIRKMQCEYEYGLITVASFNHQISGAQNVVVGDGPDEADLAIANRAKQNHIVVTQDYGLAALALAKGARAISPMGLIYTDSVLPSLLHLRHASAKERRLGGKTKGPAARTKADDQVFIKSFVKVLADMGNIS